MHKMKIINYLFIYLFINAYTIYKSLVKIYSMFTQNENG